MDPQDYNDQLNQHQRVSYANRRDSLSTLRRRARYRKQKAAGKLRTTAKAKVRPCPNEGCVNIIVYYTRPPKQCDACWERVATKGIRDTT